MSLKDLQTGQSEVVWADPPLIPDANLQYFFNSTSILLNYKNEQMEGVVAPTDSRFRNDLRHYEEGNIEEADAEKVLIEEL